jgi:hypothetical protein
MEAQFIVPVSTMLAGLGLWLAYIVTRAFSSAVRAWSVQAELAVATVTGGLIVFSSFT